MKRPLLLLSAVAALALSLASAPTALAGTYSISNSTSDSTDGWKLKTSYNFFGCSFTSQPGPCGDGDVPAPTPLRLFAYHSAHADDEAFWYREGAAHGQHRVRVGQGAYAATADVRVFMKAHLRGYDFGSQPQLHTVANDSGTATWSIPAGNKMVGVFLKTLAIHTFANKWADTVRIDSLDAVLRDDTAPSATLSGVLASGQWLNQTQQVCVTVKATDAGAGVVTSELREGAAAPLDSHSLQVADGMQPGDPTYSHDLCLTPSHLTDGEHDLTVKVTDGAGESSQEPLTVMADSHARSRPACPRPSRPTAARRSPSR